MAHYEDLSAYEYFRASIPGGVRALNVGWLEEGEAYVKGSPPSPFLSALGLLVRDAPQMKTRGWHGCQLPHEKREAQYPLAVEISGSKVVLGGAEIRVVAESGDWLVAPDLVYHYVAAHSYLPPEPFIEAVMAGRVAPEVGSSG
ncbi:DUF7919 family protein [Streptomyces ureilyticus]|uniref:DUF7919 domain-containing protein n=1 Tax=Streptomyces ureilyticus TaxID=1775131 RepID=A0ABX0E2I1_9ACTN|nr:hypothetical protein [Streptomyces ureilyticus]NGO47913.1 hypothetical protein [Streptomyces ureilyticus]